MTDTDKDTKIKVVFQPGCFDEFEGTQEELNEMIAEIQRMADSGELFEDARELSFDELEELAEEDEVYQVVLDKLIEPEDKKRRLH
jgi:chaperonin cofactor prefoldin